MSVRGNEETKKSTISTWKEPLDYHYGAAQNQQKKIG